LELSVTDDAQITAMDIPAVDAPEKKNAKPRPTLLDLAIKRHRELHEMLTADKSSLSVDDVHDLRVATRRLGEVVGLFKHLMPDGMAAAAADSIKALRQAAGELRDLDVMNEHLEKKRLPGPLKKIADQIRADLPARRAVLETQVLAARSAASVGGAMVFLARLFEEKVSAGTQAALESLASTLKSRIKRRRKQLRSSFGKAATRQTAESLHEARIAVKKLRYVLELANTTGQSKSALELRLLKSIQQLLGDHHDVHVIHETLESHLPPRTGPAATAIKNLRPAWTKYNRKTAREQAKRAAEFFAKSYLWNAL
jgi:CHAD domain-containing protein